MGSVEKDLGDMLDKFITAKKPVCCDFCGSSVEYRGAGQYICKKCKEITYDDYGKVRLFVEENGPMPAMVISKATGVSTDIIQNMLHKGKVEIPEGSRYYLQCEKCGRSLKYGKICEDCAKKIGTSVNEYVGEAPKSTNNSMGMSGKMHYMGRRK